MLLPRLSHRMSLFPVDEPRSALTQLNVSTDVKLVFRKLNATVPSPASLQERLFQFVCWSNYCLCHVEIAWTTDTLNCRGTLASDGECRSKLWQIEWQLLTLTCTARLCLRYFSKTIAVSWATLSVAVFVVTWKESWAIVNHCFFFSVTVFVLTLKFNRRNIFY